MRSRRAPVHTCDCSGAMAAIIVYDITSADSFTRAKSWVRELQRQGAPNLIMALAGALEMCGGGSNSAAAGELATAAW